MLQTLWQIPEAGYAAPSNLHIPLKLNLLKTHQ